MYHLGDVDVHEKVILKRILNKYEMGIWTGLYSLRTGINGGFI